MSTNTSKISVTELDFDEIKSSLVTYLKSQSEFSDYNFEGSSLNVLMDILAYNTHMNSFMSNLSANEMFLDSSSIRQSTVSKAKEIGYTPRSVRASKALVNIAINNVISGVPQITMPAGTIFDTSHKYVFCTKEEYTLLPNATIPTTYEVNNVELYDGNYVAFHYTVDLSDPDQRFIIPSVDVDMSTLRVFVQPDINSTEIQEYLINDDLNRLKPDSKVFFTHETPEMQYEVTFGDGILGDDVINGNYITLTYIVASGKAEANYIDEFIPLVSIGGYGSYFVTTVEPAYGGDEKESLKDIKFLAPKMFQAQRRAVTIQDYETFLLHDYPWIESINSWGGEDNNPPIYGKIFFAIKPKHTEFISTKLKNEIIQDLINNYNVVTIIPEILDPDYIYINVESHVFYNKSETTSDESLLKNNTKTTINNYFNNTTEKFKMDFKFSPMVTKIDDTDESFDSSLSTIVVHKRVYPITNLSETFDIKFNNALTPGTIESSYFNISDTEEAGAYYKVQVKDDSNGKMILKQVSTNVIFDNDIGTVNYTTGDVSITIFPYSIPLDTLDIRIYAVPVQKNITSGYNQIILCDDSAINVDINRKQGVTVTMTATV